MKTIFTMVSASWKDGRRLGKETNGFLVLSNSLFLRINWSELINVFTPWMVNT